MSPLALLVAAGLDVVGIVIVILTVIVFLVSQLLNKLAGQQGAGGAGGPRPARQPQDAGVEEEIDDFLRQAAQRGGERPRSTHRPLPPARMAIGLPMAEVVKEVPVDSRAGHLGDERAPPIEEPALPAAVPPTAAAGLAALFGSAQTIRQAIIIHEVLQRPEERWR